MFSHCDRPIGVFDSGVGGISVLAELLRVLPHERYVYFADNANAPYGSKDLAEVQSLSMRAARFLLNHRAKCLVVACNTATSAAVAKMRDVLDVPIVGMEPAVKPAVEMHRPGAVLVMATPLTLREEKFRTLASRFSESAEIVPVPCPGLMEMIESGDVQREEIVSYLRKRLGPLLQQPIAAVVLGCTHYVFIEREVSYLVGDNVPVVHGNVGTARQLRAVLEREGLLCSTDVGPVDRPMDLEDRVAVYASANPERIIPLCRQYLSRTLGARGPGHYKKDDEIEGTLNRQ